MSIYVERREEIERYEFQYGPIRGKLAMTLDLLTDALTMTGQHGVYCTSARNPAAGSGKWCSTPQQSM